MEGSRKERVTSQQRLGFWVMGGGVVGGGTYVQVPRIVIVPEGRAGICWSSAFQSCPRELGVRGVSPTPSLTPVSCSAPLHECVHLRVC